MQEQAVDIEEKVLISKKELDALRLKLEQYKRQLDSYKRMLFGRKSERFIPIDSIQLSLFEEQIAKIEKEVEKQTITYQREKKQAPKSKPVRSAIPSHFPRVEQIIEPDNIPQGAVKIGEEVTEFLEVKPLTVYVKRIVRPKYALPKEAGVIIAELPSQPIPKGNAGASLLSFILICKFIDHLPLYRIIQIFKRQQLKISKSTIGGWVAQSSDLLRPLYNTFKEKFLENAPYVQVDESPMKVQDRQKKKTTHQGYMWVYRNPLKNSVLFDYHKGRGKTIPETFLRDFNGTLQTDGYKVYQNLKTQGNITLLGCMAHARRYFEKALDNDPTRAEHVLLLMQQLYKMERKIRERQVNTKTIKRYRMLYALPILNKIEAYMKTEEPKLLPKSSISIAMRYTLNIWKNLKQYIYDGSYEIDNNNIENAIRPLAIGRKNYLFAGSHDAAQNHAIMYTFFANCKTHNINPQEWLSDVLNRIAEHKANKLSELLPQNWKPKAENL